MRDPHGGLQKEILAESLRITAYPWINRLAVCIRFSFGCVLERVYRLHMHLGCLQFPRATCHTKMLTRTGLSDFSLANPERAHIQISESSLSFRAIEPQEQQDLPRGRLAIGFPTRVVHRKLDLTSCTIRPGTLCGEESAHVTMVDGVRESDP